jgi:hypothetical protein
VVSVFGSVGFTGTCRCRLAVRIARNAHSINLMFPYLVFSSQTKVKSRYLKRIAAIFLRKRLCHLGRDVGVRYVRKVEGLYWEVPEAGMG